MKGNFNFKKKNSKIEHFINLIIPFSNIIIPSIIPGIITSITTSITTSIITSIITSITNKIALILHFKNCIPICLLWSNVDSTITFDLILQNMKLRNTDSITLICHHCIF